MTVVIYSIILPPRCLVSGGIAPGKNSILCVCLFCSVPFLTQFLPWNLRQPSWRLRVFYRWRHSLNAIVLNAITFFGRKDKDKCWYKWLLEQNFLVTVMILFWPFLFTIIPSLVFDPLFLLWIRFLSVPSVCVHSVNLRAVRPLPQFHSSSQTLFTFQQMEPLIKTLDFIWSFTTISPQTFFCSLERSSLIAKYGKCFWKWIQQASKSYRYWRNQIYRLRYFYASQNYHFSLKSFF